MWQHATARCSRRYLSSAPSFSSPRVPWFVDSLEASLTQQLPAQRGTSPPLPPDVPLALKTLHAQLVQAPCLDPSKLLVRDPIPQPPGPPLPLSTPRGRRKRGGTYAGDGLLEPGNLWNWIVLAQVKEGTEKRGSIESLERIIRKTLLSMNPPLQLQKKARKNSHDGWAMVDAGEFVVHILSAGARERYFGDRSLW
ncbi:hypothetical protein F5148DRAFT_1277128 [Russula earlei]|uniref:Uncharacterized protein n=1 Tax=Russula earlei TaxID=71964 RepID=A0ACC0U0I8_9AGAM|nr:hypothetical protein F5148DRAFT_1277128 [Russula earlei]